MHYLKHNSKLINSRTVWSPRKCVCLCVWALKTEAVVVLLIQRGEETSHSDSRVCLLENLVIKAALDAALEYENGRLMHVFQSTIGFLEVYVTTAQVCSFLLWEQSCITEFPLLVHTAGKPITYKTHKYLEQTCNTYHLLHMYNATNQCFLLL